VCGLVLLAPRALLLQLLLLLSLILLFMMCG
jgi:hypothetical protein